MTFVDKYVTTTATGTGDGLSESTAWTWDQALVAAAAGDRVNVQAGVYSRGSATDTFANAGTALAPLWVRGYNIIPGDLNTQQRTFAGAGPWDTTHWPSLNYGIGNVTAPSLSVFQQLRIVSGRGGTIAGTSTQSRFDRCYVEAIAATATTLQGTAFNCDLVGVGGSVVSLRNYALVWFSHISGVGGTGVKMSDGLGRQSGLSHCIFHGLNTGVSITGANTFLMLDHCTFYNLSGPCVSVGAAAGSCFATNNIAFAVDSFITQSAGASAGWRLRNNALGNLVTGDYVGLGDYAAMVQGDVALATDPFNDSAHADFRLNSVAGGGAACQGAGFWPNSDIGAIQSAPSGGGSGVGGPRIGSPFIKRIG